MVVLRLIDRIAWGLRLLGVLALMFMVASIFYDTISRYFFHAPTRWSLEVNSFLVAFLALIPAASVLRERRHLGISFLYDAFPAKGQRLVGTVVPALGILFCGVLAWRGFLIAADALHYGERVSSSLGTPMVIPYSFIPVGFTVLALAFLANLIEEWWPQAAGPRTDDGAKGMFDI
jgi:TRAP-type C4-dicarboxylate transport system permease small subunit